MLVVTDSLTYAARLLPGVSGWSAGVPRPSPSLETLADRMFGNRAVHATEWPAGGPWSCLCAAESATGSQYDLLVDLGREDAALPHGVLCVAGAGSGLHGMRGRRWSAVPGNIHLSAHLIPPTGLVRSAAPLVALATVSVVETIDRIPGLEGCAGIRWVNDVFIDGAKVSGILAHVDGGAAGVTSAVIGIGLNVEMRPSIEATTFVPRTHSLRTAGGAPEACRLGPVFAALLESLAANWTSLVTGGYQEVLAAYRQRSLAIGRHVSIYVDGGDDDPVERASGRVQRLGDALELYLEGVAHPFTTGRVVIREP